MGVGVLGTTGDLTLEVELVRERMERSMVSGAVGTDKQGGIVCNAMRCVLCRSFGLFVVCQNCAMVCLGRTDRRQLHLFL